MLNKYKKKRIIFIISAFSISIFGLLFIINNFRDNIVFFYSPSELKTSENLKKVKNRQIRVGGMVKKNEINKIDAITTNFTVTDYKKDLKIYYKGILPDLFRAEQGVVAAGKYNQEKDLFIASELLIKHDENYMPPEVKNSIEK